MPDVLNQDDIDALLTAVSEGEMDEGESQRQIFSRNRRSLEDVEIRDYDFKRPERISKDQMRALHTLHDNFARNLGAGMSGLLQTIVEVRVAHAEQMTYSEFIAALPNPTCFNLIEAAQLDGRMCLELSPLVVYPIIDRLLGGSSHDLFIPQREMTRIEIGLVNKVLDQVTTAFGEAWREDATPAAMAR